MTEVVFLLPIGVILACGLVLFAMSRQLRSPLLPEAPKEQTCVANYEPMFRLLSLDEVDLLRSQPGYSRRMEAKFRAQRCRIFHGYLRSLRADFQRTCSTLKVVMVQSQSDRSDLASLLLRSQLTFTYRLALVEVNVLMYRSGIGAVDCAALFQAFSNVRTALALMTPVAEPMGA